jgi:NAD(P)-dependent dehydrogenase (short-subunit alcohol dehydrogenase family)
MDHHDSPLPPSTALVTGATRGIGRALVAELAGRGMKVYATGRDTALLESLSRETGCAHSAHDLARPEAVQELYALARVALGGVPDVVVNNAGFNSRKSPLVEATLEEFDQQYQVNLRAPFLLCREAGRDMAARGRGHIVNVVSTTALFANETIGVYTAMKAGLAHMTRILAKELRASNVKVTAVHPGGVDTTFRAQSRPDYMRPESAAKVIADAIFAPEDVVMHELIFRPMVESNF